MDTAVRTDVSQHVTSQEFMTCVKVNFSSVTNLGLNFLKLTPTSDFLSKKCFTLALVLPSSHGITMSLVGI